MARLQSVDMETENGGLTRNPYSPNAVHSTTNTARTYLMFGLTLFVIYGVGKMMLPAKKTNDPWASKGDAAGGWGSNHHHPIVSNGGAAGGQNNDSGNGPVKHYHDNLIVPPHSPPYDSNVAALELKETDLLMVIAPLVSIPSHSRPEYEKYQADYASDRGGTESGFAEEVLYDKDTPHGMAFDFLLNRDTRPVNHDDPHLIQRFVLTLLFYATGGRDENAPLSEAGGGRASGWEFDAAHFLSGLHECHWVKKNFNDGFWGILSIENDADQRVGVTKCNADMEVTEIRLGAPILHGRIALESIIFHHFSYLTLVFCFFSNES